MGLFDKVRGAKEAEAKLTKEEAFAAVSLAAIAADGVITEEEANGLVISLIRMKMFRGYNGNQMNAVLSKDINIIKKEGLNALIGKAKESLPQDLCETAFAVATDLALADGEIANEEKEILQKIQVALGVPEDKAVNIIEVMLVKNKG
ncbi:MAG: Tellurite resistance protein TerB [Methanomassiliicoccales archaeon PtaU1.Bin124]|nr:MAG: Tellurite resistance protein TerB [Methanomassiliicoccales archaeon PtaU1.Bin124]